MWVNVMSTDKQTALTDIVYWHWNTI